MTEGEWLECTNPAFLIQFLGTDLSSRKFRLLKYSWCREHLHDFPDERSVAAIETAERFAEGQLPESDCEKVSEAACQAIERWKKEGNSKHALYAQIALDTLEVMDSAYFERWRRATRQWAKFCEPDSQFCSQIRCVFGNPFHPITLNSDWLTSPVVDLARTIYEERCFDRMPILADALMDAGCDNHEILDHCRGSGPHVLGCFVVDAILNKC
jgi:hypothetical protein